MNYEEDYRIYDDVFGEENRVLNLLYKILKPSASILDVGAGQGRDTIPLLNHEKKFEVTAVEPAKSGIDCILSKVNDPSEKNRLYTINDNIENISLEKNYDVIFSSLTLGLIEPKHLGFVLQNMKEHTNYDGFNIHVLPYMTDADKKFVDVITSSYNNWTVYPVNPETRKIEGKKYISYTLFCQNG